MTTMNMISLRSQISQKVLNYFMLQHESEAYVRDLARLLHLESGNLSRKLLEMEKRGLLKSQWKGKQKYYSLNAQFPLLKEYRAIIKKTVGLEQILKAALEKVSGIKQACIFGSYAQNTMDSHSDIDLLVIGQHSTIDLHKAISPLQKSTPREINIISMSDKEYNQKKKKDSLIKSIEAKKCIKLI